MRYYRLRAAMLALLTPLPALAADEAFLRANFYNTLYHEIAHAVIDLRDIPILGREEDAADGFANIAMLEGGDPERMLDVIEGWALAAENAPEVLEDEELFGDHALDEQRLGVAVCDLIGAYPERFADVAADFGFDDERTGYCAEDYERRRRSWSRVLSGGGPGAPVRVVHGPEGDFAELAALVRGWGAAEAAARYAAGWARLPEPLVIELRACGEANAWYDPETVTVTICHDYLAEMRAQFEAAWE